MNNAHIANEIVLAIFQAQGGSLPEMASIVKAKLDTYYTNLPADNAASVSDNTPTEKEKDHD